MPELIAAVGHPLNRENEPLKSLLADGHIATWEAGNRTEYSAAEATLSDVLARLPDAVSTDPSAKGKRGRRRSDVSRRIEAINRKHQERITTLCNAIARHLQPGCNPASTPEVLRQVRGRYFAWDPEGRSGAGDWSAFFALVREFSDSAQDISTARTLLDLAATKGWIPRTARHDEGYEPVPAAWAATYNTWRSVLLTADPKSRTRVGLIGLLEMVQRAGQHPESADWARVIDTAEEHWHGAHASQPQSGSSYAGKRERERYSIRDAYRSLRSAGVIEGPDWKGWTSSRLGRLVAGRYIEAIARAYASDGSQAIPPSLARDWPGFGPVRGLVDGLYGLRRAVQHFTMPASTLAVLGIPTHGVYPRSPIRGTSARSHSRWRETTLSGRLKEVVSYATWLARNRHIDWSQPDADIRVLLDRQHLQAFRKAVLVDGVSSRFTFRRQCEVLAMLASPFAEAIACEQEDIALADEMAAVSRLLYSPQSTGGQASWVTQLRREEEESEEGQKKKAHAVEAAWTRSGELAPYSYDQLMRVRDELIADLELLAGKSLRDQVRDLQQGWQPERLWAKRVQDALFWQDQVFVPLRVSTARRVDLSERLHTADYSHIRAYIPASKMKSPKNGDFDPNYCREQDSPYSRDLYALFVAAGGARDILRTDKEGVMRERLSFYMPDAWESEESRLSYDMAYELIARCVERAESALGGLTVQELRRAGALGTHFFRHSYATCMVRNGFLEVAALYLHHADVDMIRRVYSANTAGTYDDSATICV